MNEKMLSKKKQSKIIEWLFVSLVGGWILSCIVRGTFWQIFSLDYVSEESFAVVICMLVLFTGAFALIYYWHDSIARILMFCVVLLFSLLCAFNSYGGTWTDSTNNSIGSVCYCAVLLGITILAFLYVKKDIYSVFDKIKLDKKRANSIIGIIFVCIFAIVAIATVLRYVTYSNSSFDFGIFAQMFEHMKQTGTANTTIERSQLLSHFAVHFSPIFYVLLPVYFIFSSPITLQILQALLVALSIIPIVLICRHYKLSYWMTIGISLIYALYPATAGGTFYDIHENCFLTFLILMTIWAVEKNKNIWTVVLVVLTFMVKEDAAIYILTLGAYYLFSKRHSKKGLLMIGAGLIYFVIALVLVDHFGQGMIESINETRFSNLISGDGGYVQIIQTILTNPSYVLSQVIANYSADSLDKIEYLIYMMLPVAGIIFKPKKKYSRYILLVPFLVMNVFTTYLYMHNIGFQYNFGVIALFMYMMIMNLSDMKPEKAKTMVCVSILAVVILFTSYVIPRTGYYVEKYADNKETYEQLDTALDLIPEDASVCASGYLAPHLSENLELYDQGYLDEDIYTDYLAIDLRYDSEQIDFANILASGQYESIYQVEGVIQIYKRIE